MAFNVLDYREHPLAPQEEENQFWTQNFIRRVDSFLPKINRECEYLHNNKTSITEDAFKNKILAWRDLMLATRKLCQLYKITDAQCLSRKN